MPDRGYAFGPYRRAPKWVVYAVCVAVQVMFCVWHVVGKLALNSGVNPLVFALYREIGGSAVLFVIAFVVDGRDVRLRRSDLPTFALLGFLSFTIVVGFISALSFITAQNAALLQPAIPVFTTLIGIVAGYELASAQKLAGVCCAVGGAVSVVVMNVGGLNDRDAHDLVLGNTLLVLQTLAVAISIVLQKRVLARYPVAHVAAWSYGFATLFTAAAASYWLDASADTWLFRTPAVPDAAELPGGADASGPHAPGAPVYWAWGALGYAILVPTACAHSLLSWANTQLRPSTLSIFSTIQPFGTTALALVFLRDTTVNLWQVLGAALVITGLVLTTRASRADGDGDGSGGLAYDDFGESEHSEALAAVAADDVAALPSDDTPLVAAPAEDTDRFSTADQRKSLFYGATAQAQALKRPDMGSSRGSVSGSKSPAAPVRVTVTSAAKVEAGAIAVGALKRAHSQPNDRQPPTPGTPVSPASGAAAPNGFGQPPSPAPRSPAAAGFGGRGTAHHSAARADDTASLVDAPLLTRDASSDDVVPPQPSPDAATRALLSASLVSPAARDGHARLMAVPMHIAADGSLMPAVAVGALPVASPAAALMANPNRRSPPQSHRRSFGGPADLPTTVLHHDS